MKMHRYSEMEIKTTLSRRHASALRKLLLGRKEFSDIVTQLDAGLKPMHIYSIRCAGCGQKYECVSKEKMTDDQIHRHEDYALCASCYDSEDFK